MNEKTKRRKTVKEILWIGVIIFIIMIFRSVLYEPFRIPSGSMIPTLRIGDYILVDKYEYGFKIPFSDLTFGDINFDPIYITNRHYPKKGEVIVFKYPKDLSKHYVKRVIAVPGDTIEIKNKVIFVNNIEIYTKEFNGTELQKELNEKYQKYNLTFYKVKTGEIEHKIQQDNDNYYLVDLEKRKIPEGKYFVMGDNRDFSYDSRFWGLVPIENVKGKVKFVWFSLVLPFGDSEFKMNIGRIGTWIN